MLICFTAGCKYSFSSSLKWIFASVSTIYCSNVLNYNLEVYFYSTTLISGPITRQLIPEDYNLPTCLTFITWALKVTWWTFNCDALHSISRVITFQRQRRIGQVQRNDTWPTSPRQWHNKSSVIAIQNGERALSAGRRLFISASPN